MSNYQRIGAVSIEIEGSTGDNPQEIFSKYWEEGTTPLFITQNASDVCQHLTSAGLSTFQFDVDYGKTQYPFFVARKTRFFRPDIEKTWDFITTLGTAISTYLDKQNIPLLVGACYEKTLKFFKGSNEITFPNLPKNPSLTEICSIILSSKDGDVKLTPITKLTGVSDEKLPRYFREAYYNGLLKFKNFAFLEIGKQTEQKRPDFTPDKD